MYTVKVFQSHVPLSGVSPSVFLPEGLMNSAFPRTPGEQSVCFMYVTSHFREPQGQSMTLPSSSGLLQQPTQELWQTGKVWSPWGGAHSQGLLKNLGSLVHGVFTVFE